MKWKINKEIHAREVRVISETETLGVMSIDEARKKALEMGLDLIEVAPGANPPVVKIENFGKFRYREEKKLRQQKKGSKKSELKEIRFSPFIGQSDYDTRINRINEFLNDKQKVKVVIKFTGRQMQSRDYGYKLMSRILSTIGRDRINIDMEPKFLGRHLAMVISPLSKSVKKDIKNENEENKTQN